MSKPSATRLAEVTSLLDSEYRDTLTGEQLAFMQFGFLYSQLVIEPAIQRSETAALQSFHEEFRSRVGLDDYTSPQVDYPVAQDE